MIESLKELNRICQKPRYKEVGNWMVRHIVRDAALPLTWLLLHTPITANQVTAISLLVGVSGILFFAYESPWFFLAGAILLQLWYLLDHVDGQIARYRKTACLSGRFFDFLTHHVIHGVIFFSLGVYLFRRADLFFFLLWGFGTSTVMMIFNLIHDTKYKTFFEALGKAGAFRVMAQSTTSSESHRGESPRPFLRRVFSWLHKSCEIHVLMNVLTLLALLQCFLPPSLDLRFMVFLFYGLAIPLITIAKATHLIQARKIDQEFEARFQTIDVGST